MESWSLKWIKPIRTPEELGEYYRRNMMPVTYITYRLDFIFTFLWRPGTNQEEEKQKGWGILRTGVGCFTRDFVYKVYGRFFSDKGKNQKVFPQGCKT